MNSLFEKWIKCKGTIRGIKVDGIWIDSSAICDRHEVSLQSRPLALPLVDCESQTVAALGTASQTVSPWRGWCLWCCWCQQFTVRFFFLTVCGSVEFLSSLPSPAGAGRGDRLLCLSCTPFGLSTSACPEQTAPGAAEEAPSWPSVTLLFTSVDHLEGSLTKDGVGSTEPPCLEKRMSGMGSSPVWCGYTWCMHRYSPHHLDFPIFCSYRPLSFYQWKIIKHIYKHCALDQFWGACTFLECLNLMLLPTFTPLTVISEVSIILYLLLYLFATDT